MDKVLFAWIGFTDLNASKGDIKADLGPIAQALKDIDFNVLVLISDHPEKVNQAYKKWLSSKTKAKILIKKAKLSSPTHFGDIHESVVKVVEEYKKNSSSQSQFFFHLSPGTPAMASVWILLSKTRYPAKLVETSIEKGFQFTTIPFDISADYLPDLLKGPDEDLKRLTEGLPEDAPEFKSIIHRSPSMKRLVAKARRVSIRDVPVLLLGESGTGKELFARAIHQTSPRKGRFVAVNCGAIPHELIESELFGHKKGAFTGADKTKKGYIEEASGGTLFLDEIGDLPLSAQVKFLRVLQENQVVKLGSTEPISVDIRVIAATNKNLLQEVVEENFREDLFYRLWVVILQIPPLRDREGDLTLLIKHFLDQINKKAVNQPGFKPQKLSPAARNYMLKHDWPGNIRELYNTLLRATIWPSSTTIGEQDIQEALIKYPNKANGVYGNILEKPLREGFKIQSVIEEVVRSYLEKALKESGGNKSKAAKLLGLPNYQTLTNWLKKYKVDT